tara:strand:+ start:607 stop:780 length:174 start_codon:yes stop_codon:yes gene_type:complete
MLIDLNKGVQKCCHPLVVGDIGGHKFTHLFSSLLLGVSFAKLTQYLKESFLEGKSLL